MSQRQADNLALVYDILEAYASEARLLYVRDGDAKTRSKVAKTISSGTVVRDRMKAHVLHDPWAVAAGVKQVLQDHEPVTGYEPCRTLVESSKGSLDNLRAACRELPPPVAKTLHQLCNHLRRIPDRTFLVESMGPVVLRSKTPEREEDDDKRRVLEMLLELPWNEESTKQLGQQKDDVENFRESINFFDEHLLLCSIQVQWRAGEGPNDENALADTFRHADVVKAVVNYKRNKGFVSFKDAESVRKALDTYAGLWTTAQLKPPQTIEKKHAIRHFRQHLKPIAFADDRCRKGLATNRDFESVKSLTPSIHDRILQVAWRNAPSQEQPTQAKLSDAFSKFGRINKCEMSQNDKSALIMFASKESAVAAENDYRGPWVARRLGQLHKFFNEDVKTTPIESSTSNRERCVLLSRHTKGEKMSESEVRALLETLRIAAIKTIVRDYTAVLLFKTKADALSAAARVCADSAHFSARCLDATTPTQALAESRCSSQETPLATLDQDAESSSEPAAIVPISVERAEDQLRQPQFPPYETSAKSGWRRQNEISGFSSAKNVGIQAEQVSASPINTSPEVSSHTVSANSGWRRRNTSSEFSSAKDVGIQAEQVSASPRNTSHTLSSSVDDSSSTATSKITETATMEKNGAPRALAAHDKLLKSLEAKVDVLRGDVEVIRAQSQSKIRESSATPAWRDLFLHSSRQADQTRYLYLSSYTAPVDSFRRDYRRVSPSRIFQPRDPELREWWDSVTAPSLHQRRIAEYYYASELKF